MKNPLHYQMSEYDCGPTSMLNAISYLFEREEILPEIIRNIMLYCLDCYGAEGRPGKSGTSCAAMMFLSSWLSRFGELEQMSISSKYLSGEQVYVGENSLINDALKRGGVVVVRLFYEVEHYVLFTGVEGEQIYMFDPYYDVEEFEEEGVVLTLDYPMEYNRIVPFSYFNRETGELYSLGEKEKREAVIVYNEKTKLTPEKTIEYFI